jgi:predicted lipid-binding transport protein (Tim44 family)
MYQMATVAYHTLTSTQTVVLTEPAEYNGKTYAAGSYDVAVNGRYWSQFDRLDPLDGPAREQAWTGVAHGLIAELGVGSVTASALQMGNGIAAIAAALGALLVLVGLGVIWAARPLVAPAHATARVIAPAATPA